MSCVPRVSQGEGSLHMAAVIGTTIRLFFSISSLLSFSGPWVVHVTNSNTMLCWSFFISGCPSLEVTHRPAVPLVCLFVFTAAHTHAFFNTADDVTAVQNLPYYDGSIVGIMESFLGLNTHCQLAHPIHMAEHLCLSSIPIFMSASLSTLSPIPLNLFSSNIPLAHFPKYSLAGNHPSHPTNPSS
ncbi:hypothetical protein VitviT2T_008782 [Vitis vinifera]|uniref:Nodulin-like domain-containing protein n=1 Tax=Vitis vinifera TaxID=29760 RepID=A0ABY9C3Q5_VITVI|nr:hypothetical protein VitviT2T_008782 [Vitis vinifera]